MEQPNNTKKLLKYLDKIGAEYHYEAVSEYFVITKHEEYVSNYEIQQTGHKIILVQKSGHIIIEEK